MILFFITAIIEFFIAVYIIVAVYWVLSRLYVGFVDLCDILLEYKDGIIGKAFMIILLIGMLALLKSLTL